MDPNAHERSASTPSLPSLATVSASPSDLSDDWRCGPECKRHGCHDDLRELMGNNRAWSEAMRASDPGFFQRLCDAQNPHYLWIGCSDSRVPANQIIGLAPGDVFVQRNVGNQALHTDLNAMTCLEYAVNELKVKTIIVCGHYGCGAVAAALKLPSRVSGLVSHWIGDIRQCRNEHQDELRALEAGAEQVDRLCELNVMRQTFHVATCPVVQAAWDRGQELNIYGLIYSLKDGLLKRLAGPLSHDADFAHTQVEFEDRGVTFVRGADGTMVPSAGGGGDRDGLTENLVNTMRLSSKLQAHMGWTRAPAAGASPTGGSSGGGGTAGSSPPKAAPAAAL